jgi:pSer/pThr/pTyr-binding forkhead associated (FHA) protein
MGEVAVLTVHEEGREVREYTLPRDRIFAVGRAPRVNTLQVKDQTVSAQHFKIVFKDNHFYVVDLWTTNGTSVNHECVRVHPLVPGDVIRAGLSEFVFSSQGRAQQNDAAKAAPPPLRKQSSK